jgi:hypothetical protein
VTGAIAEDTLESLRPSFRQLDETNDEVLPLVREGEPIVREQIRPFVRIARPYVRDLRPAATDLAKATPDLTASFHQLNRLVNMAAFNPGGAEPVTGNEAQDRERDEGYLFWAGWVTQNTVSLFSTSDASGPFRRALAGFSCTGIRETLSSQPAAGEIIGIANVLNIPGLCGGDATEAPGGGSPIPLPPVPSLPKSKKEGEAAPTKTEGKPVAGKKGGER